MAYSQVAAEGLIMTTFEYLAVAYSLLFSVTALRLVGALPYVFQRERVYGVHAAVVVLLIFGTVFNFWTFLGYRDIEWTFSKFLGLLAIPATLYFMASMIVPDDPHIIESWKEHYYHRRVHYYSGQVGWMVIAIINTTLILELPLTHPIRGITLGVLICGVCALSSKHEIVHKAVVGFQFIFIIIVVLFDQLIWMAY